MGFARAERSRRLPIWTTDGPILVAILLAAFALRVWRLDVRPLSTDEILTTLIVIGRSYRDVPIADVWSLSQLEQILTPVYGRAWADIWRTLADPEMHHAHPPLFYWLVYGWIDWIRPAAGDLVRALRIAPAMLGTIVVGLTYGLARTAVSRRAGLFAALLMATSPLGVQLSQDARNYTLPLVFIVAGLTLLVVIVRGLARGQSPPIAIWLAWIVVNALSCYAHYFSILSVAGQAGALAVLIGAGRVRSSGRTRGRLLMPVGASLAAIAALCLPLTAPLRADYTRLSLDRSDNEWLRPLGGVHPIGEAFTGWLSMVAPVPNDVMPTWMLVGVVALAALAILAVAIAARRVVTDALPAWSSPATVVIAAYAAIVFIELLAIVYILQKDVFRYWRYHFAYFPAVLVLIATTFAAAAEGASERRRAGGFGAGLAALLLSGLAGTVIAAFGYGFQDAYHSRRIASDVVAAGGPTLTVMGGDSFLTTSIGLSVAREIQQVSAPPALFAYVPWQLHPDGTWPGTLSNPPVSPTEVWLLHRPPRQAFPQEVEVALAGTTLTCHRPGEGPRRAGLEYQRYRCRD